MKFRFSRRVATALLTGVVALGAAGCAVMPMASEPHTFDISVPAAQPVEQTGAGPRVDSSPEQLLADFLRAVAAGPFDDYVAARRYLTADAALAWLPDAAVLVYPTGDAPSVEVDMEAEEGTGSVRFLASSSVDAAGVMSRGDPVPVTRQYSLVKDGAGQWRISSLPDGVALSAGEFESGFALASLNFLSPGRGALVPDPRWYPQRRLAAHLVSGLVGGPSESLEPAVDTAVPAGLKLAARGIEVEDQQLTVRLEGQEAPSGKDATQMLWQLRTTLQQVPGVSDVVVQINNVRLEANTAQIGPDYTPEALVGITSGGTGLAVAADSTSESGQEWQALGTFDAYLASAGAIGLHDPAIGPVAGGGAAVLSGRDQVHGEANSVPALLGEAAGQAGGGQAAGGQVGEDQDGSEQAGGTDATTKRGWTQSIPAATPPSVDRWSQVWVSSDQAGAVAAIPARGPADGDPVWLRPAELAGHKITRVRISPDGTRALLVATSPGGDKALWVGIISRDADGNPTALAVSEPEPDLQKGVLDASWSGAAGYVALVASGNERELVAGELGGETTQLQAPAGANWVSAGRGADQVLVRTEDGEVFQRQGVIWRQVSYPVGEPAFAG